MPDDVEGEGVEDYLVQVAQAFAERLAAALKEYRSRGIDGPTLLGSPETLGERCAAVAFSSAARPNAPRSGNH